LPIAAISGCARHRANSLTLDEQLLLAAKKDDTAAVQHLLQKGAHVDTKDEGGSTALALAAEFGHADTARFLMGKGADKIAAGLEGDDALISAARSGYATKVEILLKRGTSAKVKNEALLALAGKSLPAIMASPVDVQHAEILSRGASPNSKNKKGGTALSLAKKNGRTDIVPLLRAPPTSH